MILKNVIVTYIPLIGAQRSLICDWDKQKMRLGVVENADSSILVDHEASVSEVDRQNGSNYPGIVIIDGVRYNISTILMGQKYPIIIIHLP